MKPPWQITRGGRAWEMVHAATRGSDLPHVVNEKGGRALPLFSCQARHVTWAGLPNATNPGITGRDVSGR